MPIFPSQPRVVYQRTPLFNVACELRFPQVLRIQADVPADFQELIRHHFPRYESVHNAFLGQLPKELIQLMGAPPAGITHRFLSDDDYVLVLGPGSLVLSTGTYTRWEHFKAKLDEGLNALIEIYRPSYFERVGLRYQNFIDREKLMIGDWAWRDLVRPELAGELAIDAWADAAVEATSLVRCPINGDSDFVRLQHGLARVEGSSSLVYGLDFDFYTETHVEIGNERDVIERLHATSGPAFRWSISDRLHAEMAPNPA